MADLPRPWTDDDGIVADADGGLVMVRGAGGIVHEDAISIIVKAVNSYERREGLLKEVRGLLYKIHTGNYVANDLLKRFIGLITIELADEL